MTSRLRLLCVPFVAIVSTATFAFAQDLSSSDQQRTLVAQYRSPTPQYQPSAEQLKQRAQAEADMALNVQKILAEIRELRTVMIQLDADGKQKLAALKAQVDDLKINLNDAQRRLWAVCSMVEQNHAMLEKIGNYQREQWGCYAREYSTSPNYIPRYNAPFGG